MARKKQVQTRIPSDMKDRLDEYQDDRDLSQADAVRRLIRVGLDREEQVVPDGGEVMDRLNEVEEHQEQIAQAQARAQTQQLAVVSAALIYIAVTLGTGFSGLLWAVVGSGLLLVVVAVGLFGGGQ